MGQYMFMVFHVGALHDVSPMMQVPAVPQMHLCGTFPASSGISIVDRTLALL